MIENPKQSKTRSDHSNSEKKVSISSVYYLMGICGFLIATLTWVNNEMNFIYHILSKTVPLWLLLLIFGPLLIASLLVNHKNKFLEKKLNSYSKLGGTGTPEEKRVKSLGQVIHDKTPKKNFSETWLKYKNEASKIYLLGNLPKEVEKDLDEILNKPCTVNIYQSVNTTLDDTKQLLLKLLEQYRDNFSLFQIEYFSSLLFVIIAKTGEEREYEAVVRLRGYDDKFTKFILTQNEASELNSLINNALTGGLLIRVDSSDIYRQVQFEKNLYILKLNATNPNRHLNISSKALNGNELICKEMSDSLIKSKHFLDVTYVFDDNDRFSDEVFKRWININYSKAATIKIRRIIIAPKNKFSSLSPIMSEMHNKGINVYWCERESLDCLKILLRDFSLYDDQSVIHIAAKVIEEPSSWSDSHTPNETMANEPFAILTSDKFVIEDYRIRFELLISSSTEFSKISNV